MIRYYASLNFNQGFAMSNTQYPSPIQRLHRSELAVPGSAPAMFKKAYESNADYVFLDLEDAVSPNEKIEARSNVISALCELDWRSAGKTISVRINSLDTHYMYRDLIEIVENAGMHLDTVLIPKVGVPEDIYVVDALLNQIEMALNLENENVNSRIGLINADTVMELGILYSKAQKTQKEFIHVMSTESECKKVAKEKKF